ncbi:MAG: hypothetical protein Kow0090_22360 [Myxococcota bacterium]
MQAPLLMLLFAAALRIVSAFLGELDAHSLLVFLCNTLSGGVFLFLFPAYSLLYRLKLKDVHSHSTVLILSALINPLILILFEKALIQIGIHIAPPLVLGFSAGSAILLEIIFLNSDSHIKSDGGTLFPLISSALLVIALVIADPRFYNITEEKLLPDQSWELFSQLDFENPSPKGIKAPYEIGKTPVRQAFQKRFRLELFYDSPKKELLELRWLLHNNSEKEFELELYFDGISQGRFKSPARFNPDRFPRNYPPSNTFIFRKIALEEGAHTLELAQEKGEPVELELYDLTALPRRDFYKFFKSEFQITDIGDVQQLLDVARKFNHSILPRVGCYSEFKFDGGGVSIIDLPLYHSILNLSLNLVSDDLAGANALYLCFLFWILFCVLLAAVPVARRLFTDSGAALFCLIFAWAFLATLSRLLPPNDEGLFLEPLFAFLLAAVIYLSRKEPAFGWGAGLVFALVAFTMRAGQLWVFLVALGYLLFHRERFQKALSLFSAAALVSLLFWFLTGIGVSDDRLKEPFTSVLSEDIADRFFFFSKLGDPTFFTQAIWAERILLFLLFILTGSGGLFLVSLFARNQTTKPLAFGLAGYSVILAALAHHRVTYAAPIIVAGVALGFSTLGELAESKRFFRLLPPILPPLLLGLVANTIWLLSTSDDYTQTEKDRILWYSTYPGDSSRWQILRAGAARATGNNAAADERLERAGFLYPYFLKDTAFFRGKLRLSENKISEAVKFFMHSSYLERGECRYSFYSALLLGKKGRVMEGLKLIETNPACKDSVDFNYYRAAVEEIGSGEGKHIQRALFDFRSIPDESSFSPIYINTHFGWNFEVPPRLPLPID